MKNIPPAVLSKAPLLLILVGLAAFSLRPASAANFTWSAATLYNDTAISSTSGSSLITVASGTQWAVGDVIRFATTTNPFGAAAGSRYYVIAVSGSTIQLASSATSGALSATTTASSISAYQGLDWTTAANWSGSAAANSNSSVAVFPGLVTGGNAPVVINADVTVYGLTNNNNTSGSDLTLVSGANGSGGLYTLTFATNDSTTPKLTLANSANFLTFLGATGNAGVLRVGGTQGLIVNSAPGGAISGSGLSATSTAPAKQTRFVNVDWSSFSGGLQIERGVLQVQASGQLPNQTLAVGDAQSLTNSLLAGLSLNGQTASVDALVGNSLGRIYGAGTLTVGANNGSGDFGGIIGADFTGATSATNLTKSGAGTQTISGLIKGTGAVTANGGILILSGSNSYTGATTVNSSATVQIGNSSAFGSGAATVNSGGVLDLNGQSLSSIINVSGSGISNGGALINSNTVAAAVLNSEITNGASFTVGGAGDMTLQRVRSGGSPMILTKVGAGTLTLGNANTTTNMNLLAVDVESASTVNFGVTSGNFIVADRGVKIAAGGQVKYTGNSNNFISDTSEVIVASGTFDMNGLSDTAGKLTIGDGTSNGVVTGGTSSTYSVNSTYNLFGTNTSGGTSTIEALSGSVNVHLAGAVAFNKTTSGTVTLSQANTYTGATTISAGTLLVNGSLASASAVTVNGGVLGGSGLINGSVTVNGGALAPGNSPGLLTVGSLDLNAGASTNFEINGASRGTTYDAVDILSGGAIDFAGSFNLAFGSTIANGTTLDLFGFNTTSTAAFSSVASTGSYVGTWTDAGSGVWTLNSGGQLLTFSQSTGDLVVAVPEPSTVDLFGFALLATVGWVRRARRLA